MQKLPLQVAAGRCHTRQAPDNADVTFSPKQSPGAGRCHTRQAPGDRDHQVGNNDGVISIPKQKS